MIRASITLTVPERFWIGALSREFADARFRVRSARSCSDVGVAFVEVVDSTPSEILQQIERYDAVRTVEIFRRSDRRAIVQIEADEPILVELLDRTGVPIEMPFEIKAGKVHWELTTTRPRLSSLAAELDQSSIGYAVEYVRDNVQFDQTLTEHQREVIETALACGYYDSPRECTQGELASRLGLAKSTCCETLHRAEERIIKRFEEDDQPDIEPVERYT